MPELPEVETMRRGVAAVAGCKIVDVRLPKSRYRPISLTPKFATFKKGLVGKQIDSVERAGKRILFRLDSGSCIVIEPRMTGLVFLSSPPNDAHLRLIVELEVTAPGSPEQFLFWDQRGLGVVRLVTPFEYDRHYGPNKVGPDAMVADADTLRERFGESSRAIKVALLDQRALAGIGNLYASEILHLAQISPVKRCNGLTREEWHRLCDSMRRVLSDAIEHQGSTLKDGTYRIAHDEPGNYQFSHRVYQRAGKRCNSCGKGEIVRMVQAQRSTFFCPKCQPTRRGSRRRGEA